MRVTTNSIDGSRVDFERGHVLGIELGTRISIPVAEAIADYINYLLPILRLTQWRVLLYDEAPDVEGAAAQMNSRTDTWDAGVWIADKFFDDNLMPDDWRSYVLIHEMVHLHFEQGWNYADDTIKRTMGEDAHETWKRAYREFMELGIDSLAYALVKLIPEKFTLPDDPAPVTKPKSRKRKT